MIRKLQFILSFLLILGCQSVYMKMTAYPWELAITLSCLLVLFFLVVIQLKKKKMILNKEGLKKFGFNCIILNILVFSIFIYNLFFPYGNSSLNISIRDNFMILGLIIVFFDLIYFYFSTYQNNRFHFIEDVKRIVFGINIISLFFYILGPTLNILSPTSTINVFWARSANIMSYFNIFFVPQPGSYSILAQGRNTGIFIEGPMYAYVIIVALLFEIFLTKNKKNYRIVIGIIALFTTYSTTGFIVMAIGMLFYVINNLSRMKTVVKFLSIAVFPVLIVASYFFISRILNEKINMGNSANIRLSNFTSALNNWISRPIFGYGFKAEKFGNLSGHTSVFSQVVQDGGFVFLVFYIYPFFSFLNDTIEKRNFNNTFFVICYMLLILNTVVTYTTISIAMLAFLLTFSSSKEGELL